MTMPSLPEKADDPKSYNPRYNLYSRDDHFGRKACHPLLTSIDNFCYRPLLGPLRGDFHDACDALCLFTSAVFSTAMIAIPLPARLRQGRRFLLNSKEPFRSSKRKMAMSN